MSILFNYSNRALIKSHLLFNHNSLLRLLSRYTSSTTKSIRGFDQFSQLPPKLISTLNELYPKATPTPIQQSIFNMIPVRENLYALSSTGSGKTLAYLVPSIVKMLQNLSPEQIQKGKQVSIVVLVPTRELAFQVSTEAKKLLRHFPFQVLSLVGGTGRLDDLKRVVERRVDVVVGTPGRVLDLITNSSLFRHQLASCQTIVLDEGDQLLKPPFVTMVQAILKNMQHQPKLMLFSATEAKNLKQSLGVSKDTFTMVNVNEQIDKSNQLQPKINHQYYVSSHNLHPHLLYSILAKHKNDKVILFLPTVISCQLFSDWLSLLKFDLYILHGQLDQIERAKTSTKFRNAKSGILITTDVSSRGMDYPEVDLVLQWGVPTSVDQYIHRSGRTGRMGKSGDSIILLSTYEQHYVDILRKNTDLELQLLDISTKYRKPIGSKLHRINQKLDEMKPGLIKEWYRGMLRYYWTLDNSLGFNDRKLCVRIVSSWMNSLGFEIPKINWQTITIKKIDELLTKK